MSKNVSIGLQAMNVQAPPDHLDLVVVLLDKGAKSQSEPLVRPHRPVHAEYCPWRLVSEEVMLRQSVKVLGKDFSPLVDLLPLGRGAPRHSHCELKPWKF